MQIKFPLSPRPEHSVTYHSLEYKRLILVDFVLESLLQGKSIVVGYDHSKDLLGLEEFMNIRPEDQNAAQESFFEKLTRINDGLKAINHLKSFPNDALFGKQNFWELVDLYFNNFSPNSSVLAVRKSANQVFDQSLYKSCKISLNNATQLYNKQVKYFLHNSTINLSSFISKDDEGNMASKYIENFVKDAKAIQKRISSFFVRYEKHRYISFNEKLNNLKKQCLLWKEMLMNFGLEPKNDFMEHIKSDLLSLKSLCSDKTDLPSVITHATVDESIIRFEHLFKVKIEQEFKMLNVRNTKDEALDDINMDIAQLVKNVNDSQLFKKKFALNSLSLKLSYEAINRLIISLESGLYEVDNDGDLTKWLLFYNNLPLVNKNLIDALLELPKSNWQALYDQWFLYSLLQENGLNTQKNIFQILENIDETWEQIRFDFGSIASGIMKANHSSIQFVPTENLPNFQADCLILLCNTSHSIVSQCSNNYTYILGLKPTGNESEDSGFQLHESMIQAFEEEDELELRLHRSKLLAAYFIDASERTDLYLTSDCNIIIDSAYSDLKEILKEITHNGKYIKMRENAFKVYTEFFLNSSSKAYYFYDQTSLDFSSEANVYRHISKIKALQLAGYYTIAVDRTKLYDKEYVNSLMHPQTQRADA